MAMAPAVKAADSRPSPKPDRITVAAPVRVLAATRTVVVAVRAVAGVG